MRGIAVFVGGPLDEQTRELPDLIPVYRVAVKDLMSLAAAMADVSGVPIAPSYGILEYKRTRVRYGPHPGAVYELDM